MSHDTALLIWLLGALGLLLLVEALVGDLQEGRRIHLIAQAVWAGTSFILWTLV
jgi:hypothetical protein